MSNSDANIARVVTREPSFAGASDTISGSQAMRHAIDVKDTLLHERTFKWLATLPSRIRPMATARRYPRIVNRISDLWGHCEFARLYLQGLLVDRGTGKKGPSTRTKQELAALQQYYFERLSGLPAVLWNAVPLTRPRIPHQVFAPVLRNTEIEILPLQAGC
jgi:hypothetical protein